MIREFTLHLLKLKIVMSRVWDMIDIEMFAHSMNQILRGF